jgi:hypothetical protein
MSLKLLSDSNTDRIIMREWLWRGGPRRWAVTLGFIFAVVTGAAQFAVGGPAVVAVADGLVGGVLFGAIMARVGWAGARRGEPLSLTLIIHGLGSRWASGV